jgi:hypothetical protein
MKNKKIIAGVVAVILLGAGFGGGFVFAKSQTPIMGGQFPMDGMNAQLGSRTGAPGGAMRTGGNFIAGEIISKDASGITIKMQDGSTKIILIGTSAQINKSAAGTLDDLAAGTSVTVTGTTNSDGSVTAQAVQIRPQGATMGSSTPRQ